MESLKIKYVKETDIRLKLSMIKSHKITNLKKYAYNTLNGLKIIYVDYNTHHRMAEIRKKIVQIQYIFNNLTPTSRNKKITEGLRTIKLFVNDHDVVKFNNSDIENLIKIILRCCIILHLRINYLDNFFIRKRKEAQVQSAFDLYRKVVKIFHPQKTNVVINAIIQDMEKEKYFCTETICEKFVLIFLNSTQQNIAIINSLLNKIQEYMASADTVELALCVFKWISDLVACPDWPYNNTSLVMRLLEMHTASVIDAEGNPLFSQLREGLEICLRRIIRRLTSKNLFIIIDYVLNILVVEDFNDKSLAHISYCLDLATKIYKVKNLMVDVEYDSLKNILLLIASKNKLKCVVGNQTFQNIMDTSNNVEQLMKPRIFFTEAVYNLNIKKNENVDFNFIKEYRQELHVAFLTALLNHKDDINIVESLYTSMALFMTEIPSPYTASFLTCLLMNIQKRFLETHQVCNEASHRIHATVISLLSLVCLVMEAKILYNYLNSVLKQRAYSAPFLNPPLREKYLYANHFVLWNKKEYFFVDYEIRYALWKRFRLGEASDVINALELFVPVRVQNAKNANYTTHMD